MNSVLHGLSVLADQRLLAAGLVEQHRLLRALEGAVLRGGMRSQVFWGPSAPKAMRRTHGW